MAYRFRDVPAMCLRDLPVEEVVGVVTLERLPAGRQTESVNLGRLES
jgi:hypothetical protein